MMKVEQTPDLQTLKMNTFRPKCILAKTIGVFENCKTIMLCAGCHFIITYDEDENEILMNKFAELGYEVEKVEGIVYCDKEFDGLLVLS